MGGGQILAEPENAFFELRLVPILNRFREKMYFREDLLYLFLKFGRLTLLLLFKVFVNNLKKIIFCINRMFLLSNKFKNHF